MLKIQEQIVSELQRVRAAIGADFAAVAWKDAGGHLIRWRYASGNRNDRYLRMVLRPGKGFVGEVMRTLRPVVADHFEPKPGDDPREYAILLAEGLHAHVTVPVLTKSVAGGVLLVGWRSKREFADREVSLIESVAARLAEVV